MGPLHGLRVIEIAGIGPGPFCAMMLADMGAEVLRIERPGMRDLPVDLEHDFPVLNRGRPAMTLDLKRPECAEAVLNLCANADVLIEGLRPGTMERLGLSPARCMGRNPELVYGRITGWGQDGPYSMLAGHDINFIATAGALFHSGGREMPFPAMNLVGDFGAGGMLLAFGIVCAVWESQRTGSGQVVDAAMVEGSAALMAMVYGLKSLGQWQSARNSNLLDGGCHMYNVYQTADGRFLGVGCLEEKFYRTFLELLGIPFEEMADYLNPAAWPVYRARIAETLRRRTRQEWEDVFRGSDACVTPVLEPDEAPRDPHLRYRNSFIELDGVVQPAPVPRFSRSKPEAGPALRAGRNSANLLRAWGLRAESIERLQELGEVEKEH